MAIIEDVTCRIQYGRVVDDECLPILRCACGAEFAEWDYIIGIHDADARECPAKCGRKLYFRMRISVISIQD